VLKIAADGSGYGWDADGIAGEVGEGSKVKALLCSKSASAHRGTNWKNIGLRKTKKI
jgi:hypothetical protein